MPLYQYVCDRDGSFDLFRPMSRSTEDAPCPVCRAGCKRVITVPSLFTLSPLKRDAAFRNERSRHEPHVCTSGCSHKSKPPSAVTAAAGKRGRATGEPPKPKLHAYAGPRPWVIEHR